ncbi:MAG TPA: glycosyltransferase family 39 protein [Chloroflexota bacterium]|nr:glycosyltransferase family 39 protein [Chloroflexota bacterium]
MTAPLVAGAALVACVVLGQLQAPRRSRVLGRILLLAALLRLGLVALIAWVSSASGRGGIWLDDEAAYHRATLALLPHPLEQDLPSDSYNLGGNPHVGLTTLLYLAFGPDPGVVRVVNAALGVVCVLLVWRIAYQLLGPRRALIASIVAACWPPLIVWSSTTLRDTQVALAVLATWWATLVWRSGRRWLALCTGLLALFVLAGLRPYVFVLALLGLAAWAAYPALRRRDPHLLGVLALVGGGLTLAAVLLLPGQAEGLLRSLAYRQATTRMETLGKLYVRDPEFRPYGRGSLVVLRESQAGRSLAGVIQEHASPNSEVVAFTDRTIRTVATGDLIPFQQASVPLSQVLGDTLPQALMVLVGYSDASPSAPVTLVWVADALAWDVLLVLAMRGIWRGGAGARSGLFPLVMAIGTIAALAALPGAPGNAARHRAAQTAPLLIVLAVGLWPARPSRLRPLLLAGTHRPARSPTIATTGA